MVIKSDCITHCSHPVEFTLQKKKKNAKRVVFLCHVWRWRCYNTIFVYFSSRLRCLVQPAGGVPASPQSDCRGKVGVMYRSQTCASNLWHHKKDVYNAKIANHNMARCMLLSFVFRRDKSYFICHISVSFTSRPYVEDLFFLLFV